LSFYGPSVPNNDKEGFVDTCLEEYDNHLSRDNKGGIFTKNPVGKLRGKAS